MLGNLWRDVFAFVVGFDNPCEVIRAGDSEIEIGILCRGESGVLLNNSGAMGIVVLHMGHVQAIAQGEGFQLGGKGLEADTVGGGGVDVVDHPCVGAELLHIAATFQDVRKFSKRTHDAARPDRVAAAHADAVFCRNLTIDRAMLDRLVGKGVDHEIGVFKHLAPVG